MTQFWQEEKDKKKEEKTQCNKQGWPISNDIVHTFRVGGRFRIMWGEQFEIQDL